MLRDETGYRPKGVPANPVPPGAVAPRPLFELRIVVWSDGNVQVAGPVQDKIACYGALERAKDAVRAWEPPKVILPEPVLREG